jgi:hypothetical protein
MSTADSINLAIAVATALSVIVAFAVAIVTYKTVLANRAAVEVMRAQLDATTRPHILVGPVIRPMSTFIQLRIVNTGGSSAKNLRLSLDKDYYFNAEQSPAKNLKTFAAFTHPIAEFPPQAELLFHLAVGHRILRSDLSPLRFTVTAQYEYSGRDVKEENVVDLQPFGNSGKPIDPLAERLEGIEAQLKELVRVVRRDDD